MLSCERIAFAGDRGTVKFMVLGVMVVDKARLLHHPATGRVGSGVAAGQPVTICIFEPVFYNRAEGFGGKALVPPRFADAVSRLPDALGEIQPGPRGFLLGLPRQAVIDADGAEHLPGGFFHNGPLVENGSRPGHWPS